MREREREKGNDIWWSDFSFGVYLQEIQFLSFEVKE